METCGAEWAPESDADVGVVDSMTNRFESAADLELRNEFGVVLRSREVMPIGRTRVIIANRVFIELIRLAGGGT